jgi:hypothetical protein
MKKIIALILALSMLTVAGTACKDKKDTSDGASSAVNVGPNNNPDEEWMNNIDESNISIEDFDIPLQVGKNLDSNEIMKMMFPEAAELAGVNTTTAATTTKVTTKAAAKTVAQTVTDSSGKAVTDAAGSAVTTMVTTTAATVDAASHVPVMEELQSLWINVSRSRDYVFEGKMITITFRVKDDAPVNAISPIQILRPDFCNYGSNTSNGHPEQLYPAIIDGSVTVGSTPKSGGSSQRDFAVYVDNVAAQPGDEVVVNINVANNPGFVAFQLYFSYDSALLEYISSSEGSDFQNAMK